MTWIIFNSTLSVFAAGFVAYKLIAFGDMLTASERFGMSLMGASMVLTMAILWDVQRLGTPFDGWSSSLFRIGLMIYLAGRLNRFVRHRHNNDLQIWSMTRELEERRNRR